MSALGGNAGWNETLADLKSGVILDHPAARLLCEFELLEIFWRHSSQAKAMVGREPEAAIIGRLSKDDAPVRPSGAKAGQPGFDECASNSLCLSSRHHRHGTKPEPAVTAPVNRHG